MDKDDHGCRHELLIIVKSIVKWQRTSLGLLESYHRGAPLCIALQTIEMIGIVGIPELLENTL